MKCIIYPFLLTFFLFSTSIALAQNSSTAFDKGSIVLHGSVQIGSQVPVIGGIEFAISNSIGIGAKLWYLSADGVNTTAPELELNYHFLPSFKKYNSKFDPYIGVLAGIPYLSIPAINMKATGDTYMDAQIGSRYYITKRLGVFAALNIGLINDPSTLLEAGIQFKLK